MKLRVLIIFNGLRVWWAWWCLSEAAVACGLVLTPQSVNEEAGWGPGASDDTTGRGRMLEVGFAFSLAVNEVFYILTWISWDWMLPGLPCGSHFKRIWGSVLRCILLSWWHLKLWFRCVNLTLMGGEGTAGTHFSLFRTRVLQGLNA